MAIPYLDPHRVTSTQAYLLDFSTITMKWAAHHTPHLPKFKAQIIKENERKNIMQIKYTLNMAGLESNSKI